MTHSVKIKLLLKGGGDKFFCRLEELSLGRKP